MKASFGIDPGLTKTGMTAFPDADTSDILAWATFSCTGTKNPDLARVLSLASAVIDNMLRWIVEFKILDLDIGIELPILGRGRNRTVNPQAYAKQYRLVQEIESGIYYRVAPEVRECWVTEIYPATAKNLACNYGDATKAEIIEASPFIIDEPLDVLEAIADAWAIGLSTWGGVKKPADRLNLSEMKPAKVGELYGRNE